MVMMKILVESKQCPKCKNQIFRDYQTGPGKWFWCDTCGDFTIHPNPKFLNEISTSRQEDGGI